MAKTKLGAPRNVDIQVGRRLRDARLLAGMTQTQLGDKVGISFQQIQKYEKGLNRIGASRLQEFAQILNIPTSYFFQDSEAGLAETAPVEIITGELHTRQIAELVRNFKRIHNAELRAKITSTVRSIADNIANPKENDIAAE